MKGEGQPDRTVICGYCDTPAKLVGGKVIYPHRSDLYCLNFWFCQPCGAYVGCHKNSKDHAPLGHLSNKELRDYKQKVHAVFDPIWRSGRKTRKEAYQWLADELGIDIKRCHIGMFDVATCKAAMAIAVRA